MFLLYAAITGTTEGSCCPLKKITEKEIMVNTNVKLILIREQAQKYKTPKRA